MCSKGNHDLIELYRAHQLYDAIHVVRWCRKCGAVVVDTDVDGEIIPGKVQKMLSPIGKT